MYRTDFGWSTMRIGLYGMKIWTTFPRMLLASIFLCRPAFTDDWPGPIEREVFSPSRSLKVRIVPGKSYGDMMGSAGASKGPYATAEVYKLAETHQYRFVRRFTLLNPVAPYDVFLTDDGKLITFDNWANLGYGKVAVFYRPDGSVVRAYTLGDLFPGTGGRKQFTRSTSSISWRTPAYSLQYREREVQLRLRGQRKVCVPLETKGRTVQFDLDTGEYYPWTGTPCTPSW
jgi:hypothetical protein